MKKSSEKISVFRERWHNDEQYISVVRQLNELMDGKYRAKFWIENDKALREYKLVTISNWLTKTNKNMFTELMDISNRALEWLPVYYNNELGKYYIDFRGFPNDNNGYQLALSFLQNVDLSYSYTTNMGSYMFSSLDNCIFNKSNMHGITSGHYYKDCVFFESNLSRTSWDCVYVERCEHVKCNISRPRIYRIHCVDSTYDQCKFRRTYFGHSLFINTSFKKCDFEGAMMAESRFINCSFQNCNMEKIDEPPDIRNMI